jgi:hypothetical protein
MKSSILIISFILVIQISFGQSADELEIKTIRKALD